MHIKEMVGDFDYMVYRGKVFTFRGNYTDCGAKFRELTTGELAIFNFSDGIPEEIEFVKKVEPKYDVTKDFERLVDMVEDWNGKILWKPDVCDGFDLISEVLIFKNRSGIKFTVDKSRLDKAMPIFDALILRKTHPFESIDFIENQVNIVFKDRNIEIIKFEEPERTRIKVIH